MKINLLISPKWAYLLWWTCLGSTSVGLASDVLPVVPEGLTHIKTIKGAIRPKSITHSGNGYFFAQNMMYRHSITVYDRHFNLVRTISDKVRLAQLGHPGYAGSHRGAPVEVAFSPDASYAWVSNYQMEGPGFDHPGSDKCKISPDYDKGFVYKIDLASLQIRAAVKVGCVPKYLATTHDGRYLLVSNWCSGDVSLVQAHAHEIRATVKVGAYPRGIAIDRDDRYAYVAVMGSRDIAIIDINTQQVTGHITVGRTPRHLCLHPDGKHLFVSLNREGKVVKVGLERREVVKSLASGSSPRSMCLTPDGAFLYVVQYTEDRLSKIRTRDMHLVEKQKTQDKPIGVTFDPIDRRVWVACYSGSIMVFEDRSLPEPAPPFRLEHPLAQFFDMEQAPSAPAIPYAYADFRPPGIPAPEASSPAPPPSLPSLSGLRLVLGSFSQLANAHKLLRRVQQLGLTAEIIPGPKGFHRVAYGHFDTELRAKKAAARLKKTHGMNAWVLAR